MLPRKDLAVLAATSTAVGLAAYPFVAQGIRQAKNGWRQNPTRMASLLGTSFLTGQVVFWIAGSDQIGFFMKPVMKLGVGPRVGRMVYRRLPSTTRTAWTVKILEILTDAARMPIEGALYHRHGIVPDVVACAVTQPLWTVIEVIEKTSGVVLHRERVDNPEQVVQSLANIYGNLFRYGQAAVLMKHSESINRHLTSQINHRLRRVFSRF